MGRTFVSYKRFATGKALAQGEFISLEHFKLPQISKKETPAYKAGVSFLEAPPRFELGNRGFADPCLTTWLCRQTMERPLSFGASDEARTRYLHLGKVALYQMSYTRIVCPGSCGYATSWGFGASGRNRTNDTRIFSPLLYQLSYRGI